MTFSLSRCASNKKQASHPLPDSAPSNEKNDKTRKRTLPPIPCYRAYSELERLEQEFLQEKQPTKSKRRISRIAVPLSSFSSSEEESDGGIFHSAFSKRKTSSVTTKLLSETTRAKHPTNEDGGCVDDRGDESGAGQSSVRTASSFHPKTKDDTVHSPVTNATDDIMCDVQTDKTINSTELLVTEQDLASAEENQKIRTDVTALKQHIDVIFSTTDLEKTSLKEFLEKLAATLGRPLEFHERKSAKEYVKSLVHTRCRDTEVADRPVDNVITSNNVFDNEGQTPIIAKENASRRSSATIPVVPQEHDSSKGENAPVAKIDTECSYLAANMPWNVVEMMDQEGPISLQENDGLKVCNTIGEIENYAKKRKRGGCKPLLEAHTHQTSEPHQDEKLPKLTSNATRKRTRRGSCALCTTCPCNHNTDKNGVVDMSTFARSDAAIEKALIRRVQKLEKACELNESRMEMVRRKLKQHRRDMWKKKENRQKSTKTKTQYEFLPDVEELEEATHGGSNIFPQYIVRNAQKAVFPDTPCVQATLTQLMGFSSKNQSIEEKDGFVNDRLATIPEDGAEDNNSEGGSDVSFQGGTGQVEHVEYSKGAQHDECICGQEWNTNIRNSIDDSFSIWRAATIPTTQTESFRLSELSQRCGHKRALPRCDWDFLFQDNQIAGTDGNGIEQLVGLFDDSITSHNETDTSNMAVDSSPVHLSDLSQRGKNKALELISWMEEDCSKMEALQMTCPSWRENLAFCMKQEKEHIRAALKRIQDRRKLMMEYKRRVIEAWERQEMVLALFEQGLHSSLGRFSPCHADTESGNSHFDCALSNEVVVERETSFPCDAPLECKSEGDHESSSDFGGYILSY